MKNLNRQALLAVSLGLAFVFAGCAANTDATTDPSESQGTVSGGASASATKAPASGAQTTGLAAGPPRVDLGSAADYAILARSGVSTTGDTSVVGDIGVSPAEGTTITGFALIMDASNQYSRSSLVTGKVYAADYAVPSPARMTDAVGDMETAYTDAAGRTNPTATELGDGNIGGMTLQPGLYKWGTAVNILTDVTLSGGPDDVWIFQIAQTLDVAPGAKVILSGGADARNVVWQVAGQATLGTTSDVSGTILGHTAIVLNTGATLAGSALAQTAVTLDTNEVKKDT